MVEEKILKRNQLLEQFQMRLRNTRPQLERLLHNEDGSGKQVLVGMNDLAREVGFPRKIKEGETIKEMIEELWPYIENYESS